MVGTKFVAVCAVGALLLCALAAPAHADDLSDQIKEIVKEEMGKKDGLRAHWKNGLRLDSADKAFKLKLGGRVMVDTAFYDDDDFLALGIPDSDMEDGFEFRRVRLYNSGLIYDNVEYKLQVDFAGGTGEDAGDGVDFKDVYVGLKDMDDCLGCLFPNIRVGHFKHPMGLEELTSSKYITHMERSAPTNAFAPSRKTGLMIHDSLLGGQLNWAASIFSPVSDSVGDGDWDDGYAIAGRLAWTPWLNCDCDCQLLHVGVSYMLQEDLKGKRFRARPPTHMTDRFVNTGTIADVTSYSTIGFEAALVYGPLSLQGEYFIADVDSPSAGDPSFSGWYAQASWWLTGECRTYKKGTFSRVKPCCNFLSNDCCCMGGFELRARVSNLDLIDAGIDGGEQFAITAGVNWHLNPNTRVMAEYFTAEVNGTPAGFNGGTTTFNDTSISGFQMRFQVDF